MTTELTPQKYKVHVRRPQPSFQQLLQSQQNQPQYAYLVFPQQLQSEKNPRLSGSFNSSVSGVYHEPPQIFSSPLAPNGLQTAKVKLITKIPTRYLMHEDLERPRRQSRSGEFYDATHQSHKSSKRHTSVTSSKTSMKNERQSSARGERKTETFKVLSAQKYETQKIRLALEPTLMTEPGVELPPALGSSFLVDPIANLGNYSSLPAAEAKQRASEPFRFNLESAVSLSNDLSPRARGRRTEVPRRLHLIDEVDDAEEVRARITEKQRYFAELAKSRADFGAKPEQMNKQKSNPYQADRKNDSELHVDARLNNSTSSNPHLRPDEATFEAENVNFLHQNALLEQKLQQQQLLLEQQQQLQKQEMSKNTPQAQLNRKGTFVANSPVAAGSGSFMSPYVAQLNRKGTFVNSNTPMTQNQLSPKLAYQNNLVNQKNVMNFSNQQPAFYMQ